ncbi:hypothetical protein [Acinetobacter tandoii]|uniref:hypothetical protein n=1 Tax=Acinetobacter tandoii TaxID=202954 RepID=UPI00301B4DED
MTYIEMLQDPKIKQRLENKLIAHVNSEYMKAGLSPPLPIIRNNMTYYEDEKVTKLANRVRVGIVILAQLLDELEEK